MRTMAAAKSVSSRAAFVVLLIWIVGSGGDRESGVDVMGQRSCCSPPTRSPRSECDSSARKYGVAFLR
jgi:hypothetical protein